MPSPFSWDPTKPAGGDALNIGDDQIRADKATLRDVLRTLIPFGGAGVTAGWRVTQENNDIYMAVNAKFDGTNWSHDDTTQDAVGFRFSGGATGVADVIFRDAAASTWLPAAWITRAKFTGAALDFALGIAARVGTTDAFDLILKRAGVDKITVGAGSVVFVDPVVTQAGLPGTPGLALADTNLGFFRQALNTIGIVTAGVERWRVGAAGDLQAVDATVILKGPVANTARLRHTRPIVQVKKSANQSIPDNTDTVLTFDLEDDDTDALHDNVTNNSRLTAGIAGKWGVFGALRFDANATGYRTTQIRKNGVGLVNVHTSSIVGAANIELVPFYKEITLAAGDYMECLARHTAGVALNVDAADTYFGMMYLGE